MIRVYAADEWGCRRRDNSMLPRAPAAGIVIHHSRTRNRGPLSQAIECQEAFDLAQRRQAADLRQGRRDSGHHFLVSRGGLLLEGRQGSVQYARQGQVLAGAHAQNELADHCYLGVLCEGTYDKEAMPAEQWRALVTLCAWLLFAARLLSREIYPHSRFGGKGCPGAWLEDRLEDLRREVHAAKLMILKVALHECAPPVRENAGQ